MISPIDRTLKLAPKTFNGVGMEDASDILSLPMGYSPMLKAKGTDLVVARKLVRGYRGAGIDIGLDNRRQGFTLHVLNDLCLNIAAALSHSENSRFSGRPAPALSFPFSANISFVGLNDDAQSAASGFHHEPDLLRDSPCAFIGYAKLALKLFSRNAVLGLAHEEDCMEPKRQWRGAFMEDRSCRWGDMMPAPRADIISAARKRIVGIFMGALHALNTVMIFVMEYCRQASPIIWEVFAEVFDRVFLFHALSLADELSVVKG